MNEYIGIPYKLGGRDREGLDCYGLVAMVFREHFDIQVPDWVTAGMSLQDKSNAINDVLGTGEWTPLPKPTHQCMAVCHRTKLAHHIGIVWGRGVLHAIDPVGVVWEELPRFERRFTVVEYGIWTP